MNARALLAAMEAGWPPERVVRVGPFRLRVAPGGGNRVGCATAEAPALPADFAALAAAATALGQQPTVMLAEDEDALDTALAAAGWAAGEAVTLCALPLVPATTPPPPMAAFAVWPPLAVQRRLWAEAGIGPARLAIMDRAAGPKTALMARTGDRVAGCGFAVVTGGVAFLHALAVPPAFRRRGSGRALVRMAADWAAAQGAGTLALAVSRGNVPALALYASEGFAIVGHYHYRVTGGSGPEQ
jgi:GNAT superfamily N-acetyltransferase